MEDYRQIDLAAWTKFGEGGNGVTYVSLDEPDVILKVNKPALSTLEFVKREFDVSKAVESLGIPIPKVYEIVRVGDAYATISERVKSKKSLSRICCDEPALTEAMAGVLCEHGKKLFDTQCNTDIFPNRREQLMRALDKVQFIGEKNRRILSGFARTIEDRTTCVHGDFQTGNIIRSGEGYFWIDLDRFGYGDPMFDIGHLFLICNVYSKMKQVQEIFHMGEAQLRVFWEAFARAYTGEDDHSAFDHLAGKFSCLDIVLRYEFQKSGLAERLFFAFHIRHLIKQYYS